MSIRCEIGGVLRQVKQRSGTQRHFLALVKESCGYKRSYTYWLINIHKLSEQHPLLKKTTLQVRQLQQSWKDLRRKITSEPEFWRRDNVYSLV